MSSSTGGGGEEGFASSSPSKRRKIVESALHSHSHEDQNTVQTTSSSDQPASTTTSTHMKPQSSNSGSMSSSVNFPEAYIFHMLTFFMEIDYIMSQHLERQRKLAQHIQENVDEIIKRMMAGKHASNQSLEQIIEQVNKTKDDFDYVSFIEEYAGGNLASHLAANWLGDEQYVEAFPTHEKTVEGQEIPILAASNPTALALVCSGFRQELQTSYEVRQTPVQQITNELNRAAEVLDGSAQLAVKYTLNMMPSQIKSFQLSCNSKGSNHSPPMDLDSETCRLLYETIEEYLFENLQTSQHADKQKVVHALLGVTLTRAPSPWGELLTIFENNGCLHYTPVEIYSEMNPILERWGIFNVRDYHQFYQCIAEHSKSSELCENVSKLIQDDKWNHVCEIMDLLNTIDLSNLSSYRDYNECLEQDMKELSNNQKDHGKSAKWYAARVNDVALHTLQQLKSIGDITRTFIQYIPSSNITEIFTDKGSLREKICKELRNNGIEAKGCSLMRRLSQCELALKEYRGKATDNGDLYPSPVHCSLMEALEGNPSLRAFNFILEFIHPGDGSFVLALLRHGVGKWNDVIEDSDFDFSVNKISQRLHCKTSSSKLNFIPCCIQSFLWHKLLLLYRSIEHAQEAPRNPNLK